MLHCLFNKNRLIECFSDEDSITKYKQYDTQNPTMQNISILTNKNVGNIMNLKETVNKLNKELKMVTDMSGQIQKNTQLIKTIIQSSVNPNFNTGLTTLKTKKSN